MGNKGRENQTCSLAPLEKLFWGWVQVAKQLCYPPLDNQTPHILRNTPVLLVPGRDTAGDLGGRRRSRQFLPELSLRHAAPHPVCMRQRNLKVYHVFREGIILRGS